MPWTEKPPTDVEAGDPGHAELHNTVDRAVIEIQQAIDALPPGSKGDKGDPGDKGDKGDKGDPGDVSTAQFNELADRIESVETRVTALEG